MKRVVKLPKKAVAILLAIVLLLSSVLVSGNLVFAEGEKVSVSFLVEDTAKNPLKNAKITIFSDSSMDTGFKLDSEKSDEDGIATFSLDEIDVYYYLVEKDGMKSVSDSVTKTAPNATITMSYIVDCHTCNGAGEVICSTCSGTGKQYASDTCGDCNGTGKVSSSSPCETCAGTGFIHDEFLDSDVNCTECAGTGTISADVDCISCNGTGFVQTLVNCSTCAGNKKVECVDCFGTGKHEAYDYSVSLITSVVRKTKNNTVIDNFKDSSGNPITIDKSSIQISSSDSSVIAVDDNGSTVSAKGKAGSSATVTISIPFDKTNGYKPKVYNTVITVQRSNDAPMGYTQSELTYNGNSQNLLELNSDSSKIDVDFNSVQYTVTNTDNNVQTVFTGTEMPTATDAGTYQISVVDNDHLNAAEFVVEIAKAELTVKPLPGQTKEFGDVPNIDYEVVGAVNNEITKDNFVGGFTYQGYAVEAGDTAGENLIVPTTNFELDQTNDVNKNYLLPTANINPDKTTISVNEIKEGISVSLPDGYHKNAKTNDIWYNASYFTAGNEAVIINAPEGYLISKTTNYSDFGESVSFATEQDCEEITLYLKETIDSSSSNWGIMHNLIDWGAYLFEKTLGKTTFTTVKFGIDKTAPTMDQVTFKTENDNLFASIGRVLTFGSFFNKQIVADVDSSDDRSGVDNVVVKYDAISDEFAFTSDNNKHFVISSDETVTGRFYVKVTDNAGNNNSAENALATSSNSNIADDTSPVIMIENNAPVISKIESVADGRESVYTVNSKKVYSGDASFKFSIEDMESALYYTEITVNGVKLDKYQYFYGNNESATKNAYYEVNTSDFEAKEDTGAYTIQVHYSDAAGNDNTAEETIYVDRHAPIVKSFEITGIVGTKDDNEIPHNVEASSYGFYFKESANVEVIFGDYVENNEFLSGIKCVKIYLVDKDNGKLYQITKEGEMSEIETMDEVSAIPVSSLSSVDDELNDVKSFSFTVDKDFKGQVFAKAYDNVENDLTNNAAPEKAVEIIGEQLSFDTNGYQKPNGSIIESEEKHETQEKPHIVIKPKTEVVGKDNAGRDLYSTDVEVEISVADTYSGIKKIELSAKAEFDTANNYSHTLNIGKNVKDSDAINYVGDERENDWSIDSDDQNIATELSNTIIVSNDSNDIVIAVVLTDRAGNTSSESINFSIDKSKPIITVEYDNNNVQNGKYYQDSRIATITIKELNFTQELVEKSLYKLSEKYVVITEILDGENQNAESTFIKSKLKTATSENGTVTAYYEYTKIIKCSIQGDYSLTLTAMDNALNKDDFGRTDEFSVDTATPFIEVTFSPEEDSAATAGYFSAKREATVTITDRYFDSTHTTIAIKAVDNGKTIDAPTPTQWTKQTSDYKQSCTITFEKDGTYSFTVDSIDLSGKAATQNKVSDFTIDNTDPTIKVFINKEEVKNEDKLAYIKEVVPQVVVEDTNFSAEDTKVTLTAAIPKEETNLENQQTPISNDSEKKRENGMTYDYKNFSDEDGKTRKYDNIYTLTVETKDKAGRKIEPVTVQFSINRFGSNYVYDKAIVGSYFPKAPVIQITEVSVNPLDFNNKKTFVEVDSLSGNIQKLVSKDTIIQTVKAGEKNWYEYRYAIPSKCFETDDIYNIKLSSVDTAKRYSTNVNSDINNDEIHFTVDTTKPYFNVTNYKENDASVHEDNFVLKLRLLDDTSGIMMYKVLFDGEEYQATANNNTYENAIDLEIPIKGAEKLSDAAGRQLEITVFDAASNNIDGETFSVRISTNFWVNSLAKIQDFYHNTPVFWGTMGGIVLVAGGITWFAINRKKRKALSKESA